MSADAAGLPGPAPVRKTVCPIAPEPAAPPIGSIKPMGEIGPERTTTVLGSGRFATLSRTVVKLRSIWRDWPAHSTPRASEKTYDLGSILAGFSSAFFSAARSVVKACSRRTPTAGLHDG